MNHLEMMAQRMEKRREKLALLREQQMYGVVKVEVETDSQRELRLKQRRENAVRLGIPLNSYLRTCQ